jgi:cytochrome c-type biogenesis protein CcmE
MTHSQNTSAGANRLKFIIGGVLFAAAVIFLIISATRATAEFFMTVEELQTAEKDLTGENLRVSGAVLGETIRFDPESGLLQFTIAHIPADDALIESRGGLAAVLHQAVNDPDTPHLEVVYSGAPPDMLKDEAQAILTGTLQPDGRFLAQELLLKCPSKYEEALPEQAEE